MAERGGSVKNSLPLDRKEEVTKAEKGEPEDATLSIPSCFFLATTEKTPFWVRGGLRVSFLKQ